MLTDIFAHRYRDVPLWDAFEERDRRFLVQGFRIISEQLFPYWEGGKENPRSKPKWQTIHDRLSTELGLHELSKRYFTYPTNYGGKTQMHTTSYTLDKVCKNFVCVDYDKSIPADRFMKERISFIEIAIRERANELAVINANLPGQIAKAELDSKLVPSRGIRLPGNRVDGLKAWNQTQNNEFRASSDELNTRLRQAGYNLDYHNGFIQISSDEMTVDEIERPFWDLVSTAKWRNVDHDMKEAIDLRDTSGRDPAWYAAKALESTIKIISGEKGWTHGGEKGAINFIENLGAKKNGEFIDAWERESLINFFSAVRNPFGHGAGSSKMPELSAPQTDWAIEFCMIWIRNLIRRL